MEPVPEARKPLKWSRTRIIFDEEGHPNRTTVVDGRAGLNLISPAIINKLQIAEDELKATGTFQGVNPGRSHPKGKIMLLVTFGGELNYRTEKIVFDVVDLPLPYNGILGRPALAKFMAASH